MVCASLGSLSVHHSRGLYSDLNPSQHMFHLGSTPTPGTNLNLSPGDPAASMTMGGTHVPPHRRPPSSLSVP